MAAPVPHDLSISEPYPRKQVVETPEPTDALRRLADFAAAVDARYATAIAEAGPCPRCGAALGVFAITANRSAMLGCRTHGTRDNDEKEETR